jgi:hypothetical protein
MLCVVLGIQISHVLPSSRGVPFVSCRGLWIAAHCIRALLDWRRSAVASHSMACDPRVSTQQVATRHSTYCSRISAPSCKPIAILAFKRFHTQVAGQALHIVAASCKPQSLCRRGTTPAFYDMRSGFGEVSQTLLTALQRGLALASLGKHRYCIDS